MNRNNKKKKNHEPWVLRVVRFVFPILERVAPFLADRIFRMVFYVPLRYPAPQREQEIAREGVEFSMRVGEKTIRGRQWGNPRQPYILLVHGWAGRATQFRKFIPELVAKGFSVVGPDGPSHGQSDGRATSIPEFHQMFLSVYGKFGEPAGIITHSFGGAAMLYAAMNGLPVRKLVNIASPSIGDEILKTFLRAINGSWTSAERFKKYVIRKTGKPFDEFTALYAVTHLPSAIDLLVINDEDDRDVVFRSAEALVKAYPAARLYRTKGLGHNRILKDEAVIGEAIRFIQGN
jgi:pimeloyl-ACP methyl ester carboxylesterase